MKKSFIILLLPFALSGCTEKDILKKEEAIKTISSSPSTSSTAVEELIFHSGFEGTTKVVKETATSQYDNIKGIDNSVNPVGNWDNGLVPMFEKLTRIVYHDINRQECFADITQDPLNTSNKVLRFWLGQSTKPSARVQVFLNQGQVTDMYQSVKVLLGEEFNTLKTYADAINWMTIAEFWNDTDVSSSPYPFRITVTIAKAAGSQIFRFRATAERFDRTNNTWKIVWNQTNTEVEVPVGQWFKLDYYFKEGNQSTGRFYMAYTPNNGIKKVLVDRQDFTHHPSEVNHNGMREYNPMKMYTHPNHVNYLRERGKAMQIYFDDFAIWRNKHP